jgi:ArsR family transcriptional regulator
LNAKLVAPSKSVRRKTPAPSLRSKSSVSISAESITELAEMFRVLADESRIKILLALAHEGELHVTALCEMLSTPTKKASQPAVSHHLTLLRMFHLVSYRRDGKHNFYRLDTNHLRELIEQIFAESSNGQKQFQFPGFSLAYRSK